MSEIEDGIAAVIARYQRERQSEPVPPWILPPLSCAFLAEIAECLPQPLRAFEFGSGRSTEILRGAAAAVTSIDDSADWLGKAEAASAVSKREHDFSRVFPLRRCWNRLRPIKSFDLASDPELLARLRESQLILVDSPPNPAKREHALYLALKHAPAGAVIVADDLEVRATARFARRLAHQNPTLFRFWRLPIDHQLGIFYKLQNGRIRSWPTLVEFVGTWLRA